MALNNSLGLYNKKKGNQKQKTSNIVLTRVAWVAGQKAAGYLPESVQNFLSGNKMSSEIMEEYMINNIGEEPNLISDITSSMISTYGSMTYNAQDNNTLGWYGETPKVLMALEAIGGNAILTFPCLNGFPKISFHVEANQQPVATNKVPVTTNRRVVPTQFVWEFPVAYLRVYGENDAGSKTIDTRNKLQKFADNAKTSINSVTSLSFDKWEDNESGQQRPRQTPTYAEIINHLKRFQTQFGCYLYTGLGSPRMEVTTKIDIETQKGDMDCVYVRLVCTETQLFDFVNLKASGGIVNNMNTRSSNATTNGGQLNR